MNVPISEYPPGNCSDYVKLPPLELEETYIQKFIEFIHDGMSHICAESIMPAMAKKMERIAVANGYEIKAMWVPVNDSDQGKTFATYFYERKKSN